MPRERKKKGNEKPGGEQEEFTSLATAEPGRIRKAVRVYPDELCPEWGSLPLSQQKQLIMAAVRLGVRQIQQNPDLRCALGIEKIGGTTLLMEKQMEGDNEIEDSFVLSLE